MTDPRGERTLAVTAVQPSQAIPEQALVWLGDAEKPHGKSLLWDTRKRGALPTVGQVVPE
ncbi:MAG: hypothetical protein Q7T33_02510 [Dehalococcoidia bacterium]|nr:hypothetical protein [Dehalococcoidia bacterium]